MHFWNFTALFDQRNLDHFNTSHKISYNYPSLSFTTILSCGLSQAQHFITMCVESRPLKVDWVVIYFSNKSNFDSKKCIYLVFLFFSIFSLLCLAVFDCVLNNLACRFKNEMIIHVSIILRHIKIWILICNSPLTNTSEKKLYLLWTTNDLPLLLSVNVRTP